MLRDANEIHAAARPGDLNLRARQTSFDIARGMMRVAPGVFDLSRETRETLDFYGVAGHDNKSFAWQCLVARRLIENGVRTVELVDTGSNNNWDVHSNMQDHRPKALRVDRPLAALLTDLRRRGMLDDTLVAICTEFGRTPWTDKAGGRGRNHYAAAFTCLLAGAGVKGGPLTAKPTSMGFRSWPTRSTCTTTTRRSSTRWESTTNASRTATPAAISA